MVRKIPEASVLAVAAEFCSCNIAAAAAVAIRKEKEARAVTTTAEGFVFPKKKR